MPKTITPLGRKVVVELETAKTWRGIHIPEHIVSHVENVFAEKRIGVVVGVGTGKNIPVKLGDRVLLPQGFPAAKQVWMDGKQYWSFDADALLGVLENAS